MLADKIRELIEDEGKEQQAYINSLSEKERECLYENINKVVKLINKIKENTQLLSELKIKLKMDRKKELIYVTNMKEVFDNKIIYDRDIYSSEQETDFINFFSNQKELPLFSQIESLKNWMLNEGIESITIRNEHDGGGVKSWNSYWIKLKPESYNRIY